MKGLYFSKGLFPTALLKPTADYILGVQSEDGAIPWFAGGKTDPWDHIEAAMGLSIFGEYARAELAYNWLAQQQLDDGSWWAHYEGNVPVKGDRRETNFIAYCATGVWHHFLITQDLQFLQRSLPMVEKAINFVLSHQADTGEIYWAVNNDGSSPTLLHSLSFDTHLKPFDFLPYPRLKRATYSSPPNFLANIERKADACGVFPVPPTCIFPITSVGNFPFSLFRTPTSYKK